ncbi:MAG: C40 family peptidase [Deltaproteobacteria bacterium]|jgi:cell wall-associated NlpC family hydrolase|nr:C40 family peptidase [Deltaproteobacteria bacterium]
MLRFKANILAGKISLARLSLLLILPLFFLPACLSEKGSLSFRTDKTQPAVMSAADLPVTDDRAPQAAPDPAVQTPPAQPVKTAWISPEFKVLPQEYTLAERSEEPLAGATELPETSAVADGQSFVLFNGYDVSDSVILEARELINVPTAVQGLTGRLTTGSAGTDFLAKYGRLPRKSATVLGESLAALDYDSAPRSTRFLRMSQGVTDRLLVSAYSQTGRPFQDGGRSPKTGFDDAGFISWLFAQEGVRLPTTAAAQVAAGQAVARDELRPGDLLVYKLPKAQGYVVGLYSGNGNIILASQRHRGITEAAAFDTEYGPYFVGGRRFVDDPKAAPLSDEIKTEATNGGVKLALAELGDNIPKPANIYGGAAKKVKAKTYYKKGKTSRKSSKSKSTVRKIATKATKKVTTKSRSKR